MQKSIIKKKLKNNQPAMVQGVRTLSPDLVEILGYMGFDGAWIYNEHQAIDSSLMGHIIRAGRASGIDCMIRPGRASSSDDYTRFFEFGANGLMVPQVTGVEQVKEIVRRVKFPPVGERGMDPSKADSQFGMMELDDYLKVANDETFLVIQIEDTEVLNNVEEIAAVPGIDVVYIGIVDLSLNLGIPGKLKDSRIRDAIKRTIEACKSAGITCGTSALDVEDAEELMEMGVGFFGAGSDFKILKKGFEKVREDFKRIGFGFNES